MKSASMDSPQFYASQFRELADRFEQPRARTDWGAAIEETQNLFDAGLLLKRSVASGFLQSAPELNDAVSACNAIDIPANKLREEATQFLICLMAMIEANEQQQPSIDPGLLDAIPTTTVTIAHASGVAAFNDLIERFYQPTSIADCADQVSSMLAAYDDQMDMNTNLSGRIYDAFDLASRRAQNKRALLCRQLAEILEDEHAIETANNPPPQWDAETEARNKWVYEECCKVKPYKQIIAEMKKHPEWDNLNSASAVKRAARAYATRHCLQAIPVRQNGRPPTK